MERLRLSISFKKEYAYIFDHLKNVPNKSDYISKALEAYMSDGHTAIQSEEDIKRLVFNILQNQCNLPQPLIQPIPSTAEVMSDEDIEMIAHLF